MQCITFQTGKQVGFWLGARWHVLAVVSLVLAAVWGQPVAASAGWVTCPPPVYRVPGGKRRGLRVASGVCWVVQIHAGWGYWRRTWGQMLVRSALLVGLGLGNQRRWGVGLALLPMLEWLLAGLAVTWPWLGQQPEVRLVRWGLGWLRWASLLLLGSALLAQVLRAAVPKGRGASVPPVGWLMGGVVAQRGMGDAVAQPVVEVLSGAEGTGLRLQGEFYLPLPEDPVRQRFAILWLRQLEGPTARRGSRATHDGRRPLIPQQQLAACFGVPQPSISRWERYWLAEDWANLLSLQTPLVLTAELRARIVAVCAQFPWWSQKRVWQYLQEQGVAVTGSQVRQATQDSGWAHLKATLQRFFVVSAESIRPRDEALVTELLAQMQVLLSKLEAGETLTTVERLAIAHLHTLGTELGLRPPPRPAAAVPWAQKVQWVLFGAEAIVEEGVLRCTYCGSTAVRPKGRKPRRKRYRDVAGEWQTVDVYRYHCDDATCPYGSFTHFPLGLLPYSPYGLEWRQSVFQMYAWGRSSYRRTGQAFGLRAGRVYLWVSAYGQDLLPIAALFGVVRSSGVVGVDEKWVQVPEKAPRGHGRTRPPKPRRWMYVYLAVDVYTYDLLHIAIYACDTAASTRAFLLALRAKGYQPRVIVTDLRKEYGPAIQAVFSQAHHHECIFHALQWSHRQFKEVYGCDYATTHPAAVALREQIDAILQVKTRRTAEKRYARVMALREQYVTEQPESACIFNTLERHWSTLVNGIESTIIPRTNNAVELVIRRFDQHYQNFCGFESLETARLFLGVFEKVYRFTPFTEDAQPRIRNRCPLELAGYDVAKLPITHICRGWALHWPPDAFKEVLPNA